MSRHKNNVGTWSVYMHTVPAEINEYGYDKYYIGVTSKSPKERWSKGEGYKTQAFYRAIKKYGWDNIRHEVIASNLIKEDALDLERLLIFLYKSSDKQYGYNVAIGGQGDDMTPETIEKLSQISKANWENPEYVNNVMSNLKRGSEHHNSRKIVLLNTREVFECEFDAQRKYGVCQAAFHRYCKRESICEKKDANGNNLVFRWYEDYLDMDEETIQKEIEHDTMYCNRTKHKEPVVCLNTGEVFEYLFIPQEKYGVNRDSITGCCKHMKTYGGTLADGTRLTWAYLSEYENMSEEDIKKTMENVYGTKRKTYRRKIIDLQTMRLYASFGKCANATGLAKSTIRYAMKNRDYANGKYRDRFIYLDDYIKTSGEDEETILKTLEFVD